MYVYTDGWWRKKNYQLKLFCKQHTYTDTHKTVLANGRLLVVAWNASKHDEFAEYVSGTTGTIRRSGCQFRQWFWFEHYGFLLLRYNNYISWLRVRALCLFMCSLVVEKWILCNFAQLLIVFQRLVFLFIGYIRNNTRFLCVAQQRKKLLSFIEENRRLCQVYVRQNVFVIWHLHLDPIKILSFLEQLPQSSPRVCQFIC